MFQIVGIVTLIFVTGLFPFIESCRSVQQSYNFPNTDIFIRLKRTSSKLQYEILKGSDELQTVTFENFITNNNLEATSDGMFKLTDGSNTVEFELITSKDGVTHVRIIRNNIVDSSQPMDCISLNIGNTHWYAGPEDRHQYWPVERQVFTNYSYLTKEDHNAGLAERYWLNSDGKFFYVEDETPLFIDQNSEGYDNKLCFSAIKSLPYDVRMSQVSFIYHIGVASNAKTAHMYAVQNILGHPNEYPDERMVQYPIWSTWALYKTDIDDKIVREFADKIKSLGFENSQLEIDDDWEDCYGALTFRKSKFPDIKKLTNDLKTEGFRVTLWIHPFINKDCQQTYNDALLKGYLVLDHNKNPDTQWWNSKTGEAAYVDFTKSEVQEWFKQRLRRLQTEDGIDSFKFDAGESSWVPDDPVLNASSNFSPSQITRDYVRTVGSFGSMVEVRSGQGTQDLPIFVRMIDKDSEWKWENGLVTLITTLLQMNLNGYPFVLPDMIGGNGYNNKPPTKELFLRWLQANVFMPSLQFSYVPWNFDDETIEISKKFTKLHSDYTPKIMERFKLAATTGEPVNTPLWWADPEDKTAQGIYDQFMLGDDIIAAPVVEDSAIKRDIYLPKGTWQDGNTNVIYTGPKWIMDYSAPLDILPYFIKINS
ncbi:myogenesis-regulating glycosidase [Lucilia cuprina]|uniref:myogenesis-regulating glycosidase n=1 Tax=Lucilia cuprina TaxID=7375 RepID=UPI001F06D22F|nr:myogenesis-regulating glycosidase [Lucilia cuprina]XP_046806766.1 myogenesis-regulating glycosidase [Lucilia cuprina]